MKGVKVKIKSIVQNDVKSDIINKIYSAKNASLFFFKFIINFILISIQIILRSHEISN